tara:strand:+ start:339 stop:533 length:195 start_codon:yes stop_codon:yes gene_type:complete
MKNQARETEAAMSETVPASAQKTISMLEEQLYKKDESLKHLTMEMMKAQEKATYYKQIIMKIID